MYPYLPAIIAMLALIPLVFIAVIIIIYSNKKTKENEALQRQFTEALDYSNKLQNEKKKTIAERLVAYFSKLLKPAGVVKPDSDDEHNFVMLLVISLVIYIISLIITQDVFIGILPIVLFFAILILYCKHKISEQDALLNEQIPSFLSTLKSNIQANETPERALVGAIDSTAEPLYSELLIVKQYIELGNFTQAMTILRQRTNNEALKFLCSCIEISSNVGSNLENQITIIEKLIVDKQELDTKLESAVTENKPLIYVSSICIPGLFIFMYFLNTQARLFWFKTLLSWFLLFIIAIVFALGMWLANRVVNNVRKM